MINCKDYWEKMFIKSEENEKREEQTNFFYTLAINNLPKWISEDIQDRKMSICDAGCAIGEGTKILAQQFPESTVAGFDFSENAIGWAKEKYPEYTFFVDNIKTFNTRYDVIFSSNVCEHFYDAEKIIEKLVLCADRYCILLLPFREYYTIPEHFSYFDFQSFPLNIKNNYQLCYFKPMTMIGEEQKYWFGEQILVIYGNKDHLSRMNLSLRNLYNGYIEERTRIIEQYDEKIVRLTQKIEQLNSKLNILEEQYKTEIADKENQIVMVTKTAEESKRFYISEIEKHEIELEIKEGTLKEFHEKSKELNDINFELTKQIEDYVEYIEDRKIAANEMSKQICIVQNSKSYKYSLLIKRFFAQCIKSNDKKDFFKWILGKLTHKNISAKLLSEFDHLENAKHYLSMEQNTTADGKITVIESDTIRLKKGKTVVIFASVPFYDVGGGQRSAQLAKTFNTLGYRVYYVYGFPCTEENIPDMFIPTVEHKYIDDISIDWFNNVTDKESMIIFEIPYFKFEPYLDNAKQLGCSTIYEHIDNWDSSLGCLFYDENLYKRFLEKADLLTVTAKKLGEKIEEKTQKEYLYLPNAVNVEIFEPLKNYKCPKDLVKGKRKTLIYFGSLWGEWFEWDKIDYIADNCPDCEINLIGDYSGCIKKVNLAKKNVHFLGLKKQTELPAYLKYSDVALLPFKNCEIGKYVSPLKIFEYIAMNVKVLATNLDDIQNYPNVYCSDSKEEWIRILNEETELIDSSTFISENNWFARCGKLIEKVTVYEKKFPKISIIVLNYNNLKVIRRCVETLIAHKARYNYEVIVVDNGSQDGSYEMLKENYTRDIILVQNNKNGCSSGRNLGVKNSRGEYLCFIDSDQWVVSDYWLDSAIELLEKETKFGAVAWNAGWFTPGKTTGPIVDYLPNRAMDSSEIWCRMDIAYLATSGFIMKKQLFDVIGGFDEFYDPTCYEDTDISLKIRNQGYEIAYCPYMAIMHLPHQTTQSGSARHTSLMERNGKYFMEKWEKIQPKLLEYYI